MKDNLKRNWWEFHKKNPHVWNLFEKYTFQAIEAGFKNYGAKGIMERIRWHEEIETTGCSFKISNNHTAYYARYFHHLHPRYDGFFRTKGES